MITIIRGGTLIDGTGRPAQPGLAILIEGNRIRAIGREADFGSLQSSGETRRVDAEGKWILPGLINMHEHLVMREIAGVPREVMRMSSFELTFCAIRNALMGLRRGWTTVRDMGSPQGISLQIRGLIAEGKMPGPRIVACGAPISVTGGHAHQICAEADGPDACRKAAREQLKAGADFVKAMASHDPYPMPGEEQTRPEMSFEEIDAAFSEAHRWGKGTACHVMGTTAIGNVLRAGVRVVDHGAYLTEALAQRMAQQGTFLCPTLSAYMRQTMNPRFRRGEDWAKAHAVLVQPLQESFLTAVRAGVKVVVGTDTTGSYAEELALMRESGLSPMEAILSCTKTPAEALGLLGTIGTVEAGKLGDVVMLKADPLVDPRAIEQVDVVMKEGVLYRPPEVTV